MAIDYQSRMVNKKKASYLTIEESLAIKGMLMLLIMLGHNHILAPIGGTFFKYLYSFHIYGFFILPFLYNKKVSIEKKTFLDGFIRLWIPYIFFFLLCYFIYHIVVIKDAIDVTEIIYGIFNASQRTIKKISGFNFLWFLPAYFSMSMWMMILSNRNKLTYIIITFLMVMLICNLSYTIHNIFPIIPFAIIQGFYYFTFGFFTKLMLDKVPHIEIIASVIFLIVSILYLDNRIINYRYIYPISGFLFIYFIRKPLSKLSILVIIGKYSFPVYLIHVIIYNILERFFPKEILFGIMIFLLTLSISMIIAYLIMKVEFTQKLIFPKNWNDFKSLFIR